MQAEKLNSTTGWERMDGEATAEGFHDDGTAVIDEPSDRCFREDMKLPAGGNLIALFSRSDDSGRSAGNR